MLRYFDLASEAKSGLRERSHGRNHGLDEASTVSRERGEGNRESGREGVRHDGGGKVVASEVVMAARTGDCWCTGELDSSLSLVSGEENQTELCISRV
ncbi:hypothetical protein TB1_029666 [Malus domestica]